MADVLESLAEWASMGGYGWHVWGAYLFCLVVIAALVADSSRRKKAALRAVGKRGA